MYKKGDPYTIEWKDRDDDGDGIPNARDKCLFTPKGEVVTPFGCPMDADFDKVYDFEDSCINDPGPRSNKGCPFKDRDGDGIGDAQDKCPDVAGLPKFQGCPDTDGDGIIDIEDECPKVWGVLSYKGCPPPPNDSDHDGVSDIDDLCPDVPGPKSNKGCPEPKKEEQVALQKAFENLLFETGKDVIVKSSFPSLDQLALVMQKYPISKLHLEGHTDNVGDDQANMDLSQRRAEAVRQYLANKGVSLSRIETSGLGETKPKATNDTEEGRHINRRVEMVIIYE